MKKTSLFIVFFLALSIQVSHAAITGKAKGTPLKTPDNPANVVTCLSCHDTVKMLYDRGAHAKVNCAMCHESKPEHSTSPSAQNRPVVRTDHRVCAQCHNKQLEDMLSTKYHKKWAEKNEFSNRNQIRNPVSGLNEQVIAKMPINHISMMANIIATRTMGRYKYINPYTAYQPMEKAWDYIYDAYPNDPNDKYIDHGNPAVSMRTFSGTRLPSIARLGVCFKCKSTDHMLEYSYLDAPGAPGKDVPIVNGTPAMPLWKGFNYGVNCNFCHDPHSAEPRVLNDSLIDAMINPANKHNQYQQNLGKTGSTRAEVVNMGLRGFPRTVLILERYDSNFMCGQCHQAPGLISSLRDKDTGVRPYEEIAKTGNPYGPPPFMNNPVDLYEFYNKNNWYNDIHPVSGTKHFLPANHPNVEVVSMSAHGRAGVGCTDCHYAKVPDGKNKTRSEHQVSLPKEKVANTCIRSDCHGPGTKSDWKSPEDALYVINYVQHLSRLLLADTNVLTNTAVGLLKDHNQGVIEIEPEAFKALDDSFSRMLTVYSFWYTDHSLGMHDPKMIDESLRSSNTHLRNAIANAQKKSKPVNVKKQ
jgi:formate-dependent nitrite reductase cytochrome c552 subunit